MIKRSPSRNHRSKGIKVKHVLQIILLLGVCFWLIYQVKRSHDKKKEFDENNASVSVGTQTAYQIQKLGRKDLRPGKDEVNENEKREEEVEDENIVEEDDENIQNKHELHEQEEIQEGKEESKHEVRGQEEAQEEEQNKSEEMEDERGGGDDEIDENDEKSEVDTDRNEEFMDEEKEKEEESDEKDKENSEDEEKEGSVENHNTHEAREEHYKGDDASSAVTHDTHTTSTETETVGLENSDDNSGMNIMKSENKPNYTEESSRNQTDSDIKVTGAELMTGWTSNATSGKGTGNNSLSNPVDSSRLNSTATTHFDSHSEASSNLTVPIPGASNNMIGTGADTSSEQNKMGIFLESNHARKDMMNTSVTAADVKNVQTEEIEQRGNRVSEENLPDSKATAPIKTENGDAAASESANLEGGELETTRRSVASNETENKRITETSETSKTQNNSYMKENTDATDNGKLKDGTQTGEAGESSDSSTGSGTTDSIDHNATDSSDSHILKDVTEVQTDPDTLPAIRNEVDNSDKTATE